MRIGLLTFYRVVNFGANLQALSTYCYLKNCGHEPFFLNYYDSMVYNRIKDGSKIDSQIREHLNFVDKYIVNQSKICFNSEDINKEIKRLGIEGIIVGSDAVLQHHPLLSRMHKGRIRPFRIEGITSDRMFPNPFWGVGLIPEIKKAMMSVSSQNSRYTLFSKSMKTKMRDALTCFKYISVRDNWTYKMITEAIGVPDVCITPDPVFAFNQNVGEIINSQRNIDMREKYNLPSQYVLVSLHSQNVTLESLVELKKCFSRKGISCVAFPMPTGINFSHPFDYEIDIPLNPMDWYLLIKQSNGYVGSNMHPIVVSLHNGVPCYSIDHWGCHNYFGKPIDQGSSKVADILGMYGLSENRIAIEGGKANGFNAEKIVDVISSYPKYEVQNTSVEMLQRYNLMMSEIIEKIGAKC